MVLFETRRWRRPCHRGGQILTCQEERASLAAPSPLERPPSLPSPKIHSLFFVFVFPIVKKQKKVCTLPFLHSIKKWVC